MDSILTSIKKQIGIDSGYKHFDADIIMAINTVFSVLQQLGVGPSDGFRITDDSTTWDDYVANRPDLESLKTYIGIRVKLIFDPPTNSAVLTALKETKSELEWRLNVAAEEG